MNKSFVWEKKVKIKLNVTAVLTWVHYVDDNSQLVLEILN